MWGRDISYEAGRKIQMLRFVVRVLNKIFVYLSKHMDDTAMKKLWLLVWPMPPRCQIINYRILIIPQQCRLTLINLNVFSI